MKRKEVNVLSVLGSGGMFYFLRFIRRRKWLFLIYRSHHRNDRVDEAFRRGSLQPQNLYCCRHGQNKRREGRPAASFQKRLLRYDNSSHLVEEQDSSLRKSLAAEKSGKATLPRFSQHCTQLTSVFCWSGSASKIFCMTFSQMQTEIMKNWSNKTYFRFVPFKCVVLHIKPLCLQ